jgi:hypothetical protein
MALITFRETTGRRCYPGRPHLALRERDQERPVSLSQSKRIHTRLNKFHEAKRISTSSLKGREGAGGVCAVKRGKANGNTVA